MWFVCEKPMLTVTSSTLLSSRCLWTAWLALPVVPWDVSQPSGLPQFVPYADECHMFWRSSGQPCTVQTARCGATYAAWLDWEQLPLLLPRYMHYKEGMGRNWVQVSLKCLFWCFPGWTAGTGEVGETQVNRTQLYLRALCLWSALLSGLVQQCLGLEQCRITSAQGLAALRVSELQPLWSVRSTWAMGATKTNYQK